AVHHSCPGDQHTMGSGQASVTLIGVQVAHVRSNLDSYSETVSLDSLASEVGGVRNFGDVPAHQVGIATEPAGGQNNGAGLDRLGVAVGSGGHRPPYPSFIPEVHGSQAEGHGDRDQRMLLCPGDEMAVKGAAAAVWHCVTPVA